MVVVIALNLGNKVVHVWGTIWIQPSQNFQVEKGVVRSILANSRICLSVAVVYPGHPLGMLIWISAAPAGHVLFGKGLWLYQVLGTITKVGKGL